jgi:hypothetical protein
VTRIDPPIPLDTPRGAAWAHFALDYGSEHHTLFGCFMCADGTFWWFPAPSIRLQPNLSLGVRIAEIELPPIAAASARVGARRVSWLQQDG